MNKHGTWHSHKSQVLHLIKQMRTEAICSIYYICALSRLHWLWNKETGIKPGREPAAGDASFSRESLIKSKCPVLDDTEFISTQNHSCSFPTLILLLLWQNSSTGFILPHSSLGSGLIWLDIDNQQTNKFIEAAKRFPASKDKEAPALKLLQTNNSKVHWAEQYKESNTNILLHSTMGNS